MNEFQCFTEKRALSWQAFNVKDLQDVLSFIDSSLTPPQKNKGELEIFVVISE